MNKSKKTFDIDYQKQLEVLRFGICRQRLDLGKRLIESKKLFGEPVVTLDTHTHTVHSDGAGTVAGNRQLADWSQIDQVFITDHDACGAKDDCLELDGVRCGEEVSYMQGQHVVLLGNDVSQSEFLQTIPPIDLMAKANECAGFATFPHPAGWTNKHLELFKERLKFVRSLGSGYAMEIINGMAGTPYPFRAFNIFDQQSLVILDILLSEGKQISVVAGSDAHVSEVIGSVFTGVLAESVEDSVLFPAMRAGKTFASEAPFLLLTVNGAEMGSSIKVSNKLDVTWKMADSKGLKSLRLIANGKPVYEADCNDATLVEDNQKLTNCNYRSLRLEVVASDGFVAFSSPVFIV
jgi:hypothetical protein